MSKNIKIKVSDELYEKISQRAGKTGFKKIDNYVTSLIEDVFKEEHSEKYSKEEEEEIKNRLKSLGYIE